MTCGCEQTAKVMAGHSASVGHVEAEARLAAEEAFRARLRVDILDEALTSLGRALALLSPGGRVTEKTQRMLVAEAERVSARLGAFVREQAGNTATAAERIESQSFAVDFRDEGLRLGRARTELKDADECVRQASFLVAKVQSQPVSAELPEVHAVLEWHAT